MIEKSVNCLPETNRIKILNKVRSNQTYLQTLRLRIGMPCFHINQTVIIIILCNEMITISGYLTSMYSLFFSLLEEDSVELNKKERKKRSLNPPCRSITLSVTLKRRLFDILLTQISNAIF